MPPSPTRHRLALALALAGIALSALALDVHRRLAAGSGYTSFCNLGGAVNCDAVLGSRYSVVLGVAVPAWGIGGFAAGAALALPGALAASAGGTWAAARGSSEARSLADVQARDPRFYSWYTRLPVRPLSELTSPDCHRKGEPGAALAIVEFSDFQCPFCVQAFRDLHELVRSRAGVSLVFRPFPLDASCNRPVKGSLHPAACLPACAAEWAGRQERFREYHDVLFESNEHLERESLFRYARALGLDLTAFASCLDDPATLARVGEDVEAGARVGVNATPTLFFNGRVIAGALPDRIHYDYALIIEQHAGQAPSPQGAS